MAAARDLGPAGSARKLRTDLRQAREMVGRTQAEVARLLGWSLSKLARIETGDVGVSTEDLRALGSALELGPAVIQELIRRAETARRRGWWYEYRTEIPPGYSKLLGLEDDAEQVDEYGGQFVPGQLQTARYAEALTHRFGFLGIGLDPDQITLRVAIRMRRQEELYQRSDVPEFRVLLDESILYRRIGSRDVMVEQVSRLTELARRPYLTLRIMPFESSIVWGKPFTILRNTVTGTVVYSESQFSDVLIENPSAVEPFERLFEELWADSLDIDRSTQLLYRVAAGYATGDDPRPWLWE